MSATATVVAYVNGSRRHLKVGTTIEDLVEVLEAGGRGVAVALGREVVPRSRWREVVVEDGDEVEVVTAAAGG